jgi:xylose isomerase
MLTIDPKRVGVNIESAHAILAGLDPSDEMGYALAHDKLWTVHLNDQNGLNLTRKRRSVRLICAEHSTRFEF